ncbi:hypothetical protein BdWA1_000049 [Babesia duncani]|uniref:Uncharacterized protein n=1 Tax=Babesia duncani TaxID=323732 RepID=A0AAD9PLI6_9APIC|nr:hypothetical protein BdWA1_000049 [Babesia duncani]
MSNLLFPIYRTLTTSSITNKIQGIAYYRVQVRFAKILRWVADTPHARFMEKQTHFQDLVNYCLDNKDTMGKRDIIASLSYMRTLRGFNVSCRRFIEYSNYICDNLEPSHNSIHLLVHRFAVLGYTPALLSMYERVIKWNLENYDNKTLCIISWGYARNNILIQELYDRIGTIFISRNDGNVALTDLSLLLWSFAKIDRRVPHEINLLKAEMFKITSAIHDAVMDSKSPLNDIASQYMDDNRTFYSNITQDICMGSKALATLLPRDESTILGLLTKFFGIVDATNAPLTAQGITSLWETLALTRIKNEELLERILEHSRYLRLDHSFNSNMLNAIATSIHSLNVHDPRIVYQIVHWLEKRTVQMHAPQMFNVIQILDKMGIYHDKAWKSLGVLVQKKAIDLELSEIKILYNIYRRNGKLNYDFEILQEKVMIAFLVFWIILLPLVKTLNDLAQGELGSIINLISQKSHNVKCTSKGLGHL